MFFRRKTNSPPRVAKVGAIGCSLRNGLKMVLRFCVFCGQLAFFIMINIPSHIYKAHQKNRCAF